VCVTGVCVFITAGPITNLCGWGGGVIFAYYCSLSVCAVTMLYYCRTRAYYKLEAQAVQFKFACVLSV